MSESAQLQRLKQAQQARKENIAKWRESLIHEMELSNGITIFVHDIDLTDLMLEGNLPDFVLNSANKAAAGGNIQIDLKQINFELSQKDMEASKKMLDTIVKLAVIEPPIADVGDEEHLSIREIKLSDKMAILDWVNREVEQIHSFREGEAEPVAVVQHGDRLRVETQ